MGSKKKLIGYKGFDSDFRCNDMQYEIGKEAVHEGEIELCKSGLHFCEYPLDIFNYYAPAGSRFALVEASDVDDEKADDSKRVARSLDVKAELTIAGLVDAAVKFTFEKASWIKKRSATGDQGAASATGYGGAASATGYQGAASATGDQGAASATGTRGAAFALGIDGKAKAALGGWIILSEWRKDNNEWRRTDIKSFQVDGEKIKADTYYTLKGGKAVEA